MRAKAGEYSCAPGSVPASKKAIWNEANFKFRGVNLGGWLVLEPWITPSLFYQVKYASSNSFLVAPIKIKIEETKLPLLYFW